MPHLPNPRHESFAQARAAGARLDDAYEDAGFVLHRGHSSRLARRPEVAERIAELRADRNEAESITPQRMIATLLRMAKAGEGAQNAAVMREARLALADAAALCAAEAEARRHERLVILQQAHIDSMAAPEPEHPRRLPGACQEPATARPAPAASPQRTAGRRPLDGPSPAALLPMPASRLPVSCPKGALPGLGAPR